MQIIKPYYPLIVELSEDDVTIMHLAFYEYKDLLKKDRQLSVQKRRARMQKVCKMINLVDLMM